MIRCDHVTLSYNGRTAVEDLSMEIREGQYLCIVGENGSGKSTLIKALLGLKQPDSGKVTYEGIKPSQIGYLPQQTAIQRDFPASVNEVVLSGCLGRKGLSPFYSPRDHARARDCMERLDILPLKSRCYRELSGGQQQRVLLARALAASQKLLLLDEPVTGLDPIVAHELYDVIRCINQEQGIAVVMVTHDVHCALHEATDILHLSTQALFCGPVEEYRASSLGRHFSGGAHD